MAYTAILFKSLTDLAWYRDGEMIELYIETGFAFNQEFATLITLHNTVLKKLIWVLFVVSLTG